MKTASYILLAGFLFSSTCAWADNTSTTSSQPVSTTKPNADTPKKSETQSSDKAVVLHKPMPSPTWGKVVQYRHFQENPGKNGEMLYEFVMQDDTGIIRTATYHETSSGDGYWEVIVWDLP